MAETNSICTTCKHAFNMTVAIEKKIWDDTVERAGEEWQQSDETGEEVVKVFTRCGHPEMRKSSGKRTTLYFKVLKCSGHEKAEKAK